MGKEMYEQRKKEFLEFVKREKRLPVKWKAQFSGEKDRDDMRLWFDKIAAVGKFKDFCDEVDELLHSFGKKLLSNEEKEEEFFRCIEKLNKIPEKGKEYFSDGDEMYMWYIRYKKHRPAFETSVHESLFEYQELDLSEIWTTIREEFVGVIKNIKKIPKHGEVVLQSGIDVRVIFDKLQSFDPAFVERVMHYIQSHNENNLSIEDRTKELKDAVSKLGYIPALQESRFTDGTDMFTWYMRYKKIIVSLEDELQKLITKEPPIRKVNIYLIPNFRNTGGKFYTICSNEGARLDLSDISSFEDALKKDNSIVKRGGVILKQDEEIDTVSFKKGKTK